MRFILLLMLVSLAGVSPAAAQRREDMRWSGRSGVPVDTIRVRRASTFQAVTTRSTVALIGMFAGGLAGYSLGTYYTPHRRERGEYESDEQVLGLAIGMFVGTAAGAALPGYGSPCRFSKRFWRGLAGSVAGVVPVVILGPLGPAIGAAAFQGRC